MKLTEKDRAFLRQLQRLMQTRDLQVDLRTARPSRMVLRGTYGAAVHAAFRQSRQGVRWRFQRIFNEMYVSAFETILFIETTFGSELREHAIQISRERHQLRQRWIEAHEPLFEPAARRETTPQNDVSEPIELTRQTPSEIATTRSSRKAPDWPPNTGESTSNRRNSPD